MLSVEDLGWNRPEDMVIAGAGPAGGAGDGAVSAWKTSPSFGQETIVVIEKSAHPRSGGCRRRPDSQDDARARRAWNRARCAVEVIRGEAATPVGGVDLWPWRHAARVIRRNQFDAMLAGAARDAGVEIVERSRVLNVADAGRGARIGAGRRRRRANSRWRRRLHGQARSSRALAHAQATVSALMTDITVMPSARPNSSSSATV